MGYEFSILQIILEFFKEWHHIYQYGLLNWVTVRLAGDGVGSLGRDYNRRRRTR